MVKFYSSIELVSHKTKENSKSVLQKLHENPKENEFKADFSLAPLGMTQPAGQQWSKSGICTCPPD